MNYSHETEFKVRDYECDLQAVVNNGVYQNYLEHARHELLLSRGIDFGEVTRAGINLVVVRAELDYRDSLTSGDRFVVRSRVERRSRLRFDFIQHHRGVLVVLNQACDARLGQRDLPSQILPIFTTVHRLGRSRKLSMAEPSANCAANTESRFWEPPRRFCERTSSVVPKNNSVNCLWRSWVPKSCHLTWQSRSRTSSA